MKRLTCLLLLALSIQFAMCSGTKQNYVKAAPVSADTLDTIILRRLVCKMEDQIFSLKGYIIDTTFNTSWTATDPEGYYSFSGYERGKYAKDLSEGYTLIIKSYYNNEKEFRNKEPSIYMPSWNLESGYPGQNTDCGNYINFSNEAFDDPPFDFKDVKIIYREKTIWLFPTLFIAYDYHFEVLFTVIFKDGTRKQYYVARPDRLFNEITD